MAEFVSLFRGINVGGNQKVRMADLKEIHEALGLRQVVTYLQTGNVVFSSAETDQARLIRQLEESFAQKHGFRVMVTLRTAEQLDQLVTANPFHEQTLIEAKRVLVLFLASSPASTAEEALRQAYAGPELFRVLGQEMYLYYPESVGRSKLTNVLIERKIGTSGTGRNWNTVLELQKMLHRS